MKTLKTVLVSTVAVVALSMNSMGAGQPKMQIALHHLQEARTTLMQAEKNKGGHRERALDLVNKAINQVEEGMKFAHTH
ncbi:MAG: hypothetical protein JWO45_273 [Spartobacteria bacterium]|nr:hypothetical protein [Spartobacteria bacterium]